jgi:hypothetical protein
LIDDPDRDIGFTFAMSKNPLKKAHRISNKTFVVIDDTLVESLKINQEDTWFEQEQKDNDILLRIRRYASVKH